MNKPFEAILYTVYKIRNSQETLVEVCGFLDLLSADVTVFLMVFQDSFGVVI